MDETTQAIEAAKQELAMLQAEIDTLKARKSIIECVRESYTQTQPVTILKRRVHRSPIGSKEPPQVEVTILETDYERLTEQAQSSDWIERKILELKRLGDQLWHKLNQKELLREAINRAETAEIRCRHLDLQLAQALASQNQPTFFYDMDEGTDREIDYQALDGRDF